MMSLAASGFPTFGSDTGGYRGGMPTREALLRWAEQTSLSPVMQLGGGGDSHNPWAYDPDAVTIYRSLARLHNDLVPYLRLSAIAASRVGVPSVLSLALAFPDDLAARGDPYAYMLGPDLLVAPVVEEGATTRHVHVPAGTWVHWFTDASFTGPIDVDIDAPLGQPVLLMRQGALVPLYASDLDTLVDATDSTVVGFPARASILRARIVPAGSRELSLEDGSRLGVETTSTAITLTFTPGSESNDLRAQLDLAHGLGPHAVTSVTRTDGTALTPATDAASVEAGCDGCWFQEASGTLHVGVRGASTIMMH
jgi:alpha-glucosidase (family GH31 glycosyl hydrolase)